MGVALNSCLEFEFSHKAEPLPLKIDRSLFLKQSPFFPIAIAGIASALPGRAARGRGHKFLGASTASGRRCWNSVRRQSFWDRRWIKIRESLAPLVCNIMRLADGAASGDWRLPFRSEWSGRARSRRRRASGWRCSRDIAGDCSRRRRPRSGLRDRAAGNSFRAGCGS